MATACVTCGLGRYTNLPIGGTSCMDCSPKTYQPFQNVSSISSCYACNSPDSWSPQASTSYSQCQCNAGFYGLPNSVCTACSPGSRA